MKLPIIFFCWIAPLNIYIFAMEGSNNSQFTSWDTDPRVSLFVFAEKFDFEIADFVVSGVHDTANSWWPMSMTLLARGGRCHWHRWPLAAAVNDNADQMIFFEHLCHQLSYANFVADEQWWAVSITMLTNGGRCHWHRWPLAAAVNDNTDQTSQSWRE
jgi:hypothetical protein